MNQIKLFIILFLFPSIIAAQESFVQIGDSVPSFNFVDETGSTKNIKEFKGQNVLIVFFATWCGPCLRELPHIEEKIWDKYKNSSDFKLMIVGREHTKEELKRFKEREGYDMPFYADEDREIFSKFAPNSIPRSYLIDKDGIIKYSSIGFSESAFEELLREINTLLQDN